MFRLLNFLWPSNSEKVEEENANNTPPLLIDQQQLESLSQLQQLLEVKEQQLSEREAKLIKQEELLKEEERRIRQLFSELSGRPSLDNDQQVVNLNIGGKIFTTSLATLKSVNDTFFTGYFNNHFDPIIVPLSNNNSLYDIAYFIDRPSEHFQLVLNYLRGIDIKQKIENLSNNDLDNFIEEVVFYQITPIFDILPRRGIKLLKSKYDGIDYLDYVQFDKEYCSSKIQLDSPTIARKLGKSCNFDSCVLAMQTPTNSFKVKLICSCQDAMIGFAPKSLDLDHSFSKCGYYLYCANGNLYSQRRDGRDVYVNSRIIDGSIIECELKDGNISFIVNGTNYGIAFKDIPHAPILCPAFCLCDGGSTIELLDE
ncbi:predicted protein [Naegleria gruberi]|uniref:Predicted protein n=1 Tax=Naegleria gruberi TaxID=5762 RepID=D2VA34_NAEGR|nr:uncharacterized protein NAEGRDRAFT_65723 [Naegleria gruberi]EFC46359.1 predicted protein [Naegleria gruberi]|eukprot:XP_002679103.1 predicted protein [Naegleria gruberi strain NEG-M]